MLRKAQNLYERGNYGEGKPVWQQVLSLDRSGQLAYRGLAMAAYNEGDYDQAMKLAKSGLSYQLDMAFKAIKLSTEGIDRVCLPCKNNGIKYRTV